MAINVEIGELCKTKKLLQNKILLPRMNVWLIVRMPYANHSIEESMLDGLFSFQKTQEGWMGEAGFGLSDLR